MVFNSNLSDFYDFQEILMVLSLNKHVLSDSEYIAKDV